MPLIHLLIHFIQPFAHRRRKSGKFFFDFRTAKSSLYLLLIQNKIKSSCTCCSSKIRKRKIVTGMVKFYLWYSIFPVLIFPECAVPLYGHNGKCLIGSRFIWAIVWSRNSTITFFYTFFQRRKITSVVRQGIRTWTHDSFALIEVQVWGCN